MGNCPAYRFLAMSDAVNQAGTFCVALYGPSSYGFSLGAGITIILWLCMSCYATNKPAHVTGSRLLHPTELLSPNRDTDPALIQHRLGIGRLTWPHRPHGGHDGKIRPMVLPINSGEVCPQRGNIDQFRAGSESPASRMPPAPAGRTRLKL